VNHLEKYNEADKKAMEDAMNKSGNKGANVMALEYMGVQKMMVKKPGEKKWVQMDPSKPRTIEQYRQIVTPMCKDGTPVTMVQAE
jgi:hypothetical protein